MTASETTAPRVEAVDVAAYGPVVDIDSHVYEPASLWDDFVPSEYRALARSAFYSRPSSTGERITILNGRPARGLEERAIVRHSIWKPGLRTEDIGALDPKLTGALNPGAHDPIARLADLDALGITHQVVMPTLFLEYFPQVENPEAAAVLARAYNDWVADFASRGRGRLHPAAVLPLQHLVLAREELRRIVELGFEHVMLRPMFYPRAGVVLNDAVDTEAHAVHGVYLTDPAFEALWEDIEARDLAVYIHGATGVSTPEMSSHGPYLERVARRLNIGHRVAGSVSYLQDNYMFLTAACFSGLLEDHPSMRIALVHSGASMLPLTLEKAETYLWISGTAVYSLTKPVSLEPRHVFSRHPAVVSFDTWETAVSEAPELFVEQACWGSRYPYHDASSTGEAIARLNAAGVDEDSIRRLVGGNAMRFLRLDSTGLAL
jgi:predicted TIM-barrel fold metal-dependent hydrolase